MGEEMTVVIVDDHVNIRRLLHEWLQSAFPQCSFLEMATAKEVIAYCGQGHPRAVIMDINMPGINGIDATTRLKALRPDTKVIILTVHENGVYKDAAIKAGANAYITKRNLYDELVPVLSGLLECPGRAQ